MDFLDETAKIGYFILIVITYKQTEFPVFIFKILTVASTPVAICVYILEFSNCSRCIMFYEYIYIYISKEMFWGDTIAKYRKRIS